MRPSEAMEAYLSILPTMQPVFSWGPPGVGKSDLFRQVADTLYGSKYGYTVEEDGKLRDKTGKFTAVRPYLIDLRLVLMDPVDLRGVPMIDQKTRRATTAIPDFLPTQGEGLIVLEELPNAPQLLQSAALQLVLDRSLGDYRLPDGWAVTATGNRAEDRAGSNRTITSLNNRFLHVDIEVHHEDWMAWAVRNGIAPEVRSYINQHPKKLHEFDPATNPRAFPSPRSWAFVSRVLPTTTDRNRFDIVKGCIGDGHAAEFVAHCQHFHLIPDMNALLKGPSHAPIPTEPDVLYAVTTSIIEKCRADRKLLVNAAKYCRRLTSEFSSLLFRDLFALDRSIVNTPDGQALLTQHREAIIAAQAYNTGNVKK